jgi:rhamnosyltransferase
MNPNHCPDVFAVIVTFNPDLEILDRLMRVLLPQIAGGIIVDNGSMVDVRGWYERSGHSNLKLHEVDENIGIAGAQNIGLEAAKLTRPAFVLLMDQDSQPAADMVAQLRRSALHLMSKGVSLAAVGPRYVDERRTNTTPFTRVKGVRIEKLQCQEPDSIVDVDYVIASGCLMPMDVVNIVGGMREEMFIDYVDIEWGLRAKRQGYRSFGVCGATMVHTLGDPPMRFLGKQYTSHSPLRHYYRFRNAVWLYKRADMPLQWKIADGIRLILKFFFYSLLAKSRLSHFKMMSVGMLHGLISRMGKCEYDQNGSRKSARRAAPEASLPASGSKRMR